MHIVRLLILASMLLVCQVLTACRNVTHRTDTGLKDTEQACLVYDESGDFVGEYCIVATPVVCAFWEGESVQGECEANGYIVDCLDGSFRESVCPNKPQGACIYSFEGESSRCEMMTEGECEHTAESAVWGDIHCAEAGFIHQCEGEALWVEGESTCRAL